ncbi:hypothetical protein APY03_0924 [Variovorax sp. WDL1]|nr:hypothetical protein APY03_0924 [Variovorax sp. WDL1]
MNGWAWFALWYATGLLTSLFWPLRYRKNMRRRDWDVVLKRLPLMALCGPLGLILFFPV